jgi:hypothetical protein
VTYWIGKVLQAIALVAVAMALVAGLRTGDIRLELSILAAGAGVFIVGRILEKRGAGE